MNIQRIITSYPCLEEVFSKYEQQKSLAYLKFTSGGFWDYPLEELHSDLHWKSHDTFDETLPKDISLKDRYLEHEKIDFILWEEGLITIGEFENWMFEVYNHPSEEEDDLYEDYNKLSPFNDVIQEQMLKAKDLLK